MMPDYSNEDVIKAINNVIHSQRDRDIVYRRLIDGLTYDELSAEFNLSVRQLQRITYKAQNKIFAR